MKKLFRTILLLSVISLLAACERDYQYETYNECITIEATDVTRTSAKLYLYLGYSSSGGAYYNSKKFFKVSDNIDFQNAQTFEAERAYDYVYDSDYWYFSYEVKDLKPNTRYYYYAFVQSNNGVNEVRGETMSFTTKPLNIPTGAAKGLFSVSSTKQVFFAKGNLQYQASTGTWRFAENQYDYIGDGNLNVSATYSGWIDLFGFGTSGYNGRYPYNTWDDDTEPYGNPNGDLDGTNYDWGVYNAISNGGNQKGLWRTMSKSECNYLFTKRTNASQLYGQAQIAGTNGLIILPDDWVTPTGISFNSGIQYYTTNTYTLDQWAKMEQAGAVFLPAAGGRCFRFNSQYSGYNDIEMRDVNVEGYYRLSTVNWYNNKPSMGYIFNFMNNDGSLGGSNYGSMEMAWSVRLIRNDQ
ncbi:MAG: fibronectin type III domain-containing protein [Paludibacteraceae bacterium]|nr:fibronectin type III domain-containing protein [Paludibacteraceae bacterium]